MFHTYNKIVVVMYLHYVVNTLVLTCCGSFCIADRNKTSSRQTLQNTNKCATSSYKNKKKIFQLRPFLLILHTFNNCMFIGKVSLLVG